MKKLFTALLFASILFSYRGSTIAQPWTYDFGTATGTANNANSASGNTTFFSSTPSGGGAYRVRIGTGGGNLTLSNPGTSLGSGSEVQLNAATGTSTNKLGIFSWDNLSNILYLKSSIRYASGGNGILNISVGNSTLASDNNGYTTQYNNSIASLTVTYVNGSISSVVRTGSGSNSTISTSGISHDTNHILEIFANNSGSGVNYTKNSTVYAVNSQQWDLWIDGVKISPANGWPKANSLATGNIAGFAFFAESSSSNAATLYLDDLEYTNTFGTTTWNGSAWSVGTPDAAKNVTITGNLANMTTFTANNLTIDNGISLSFAANEDLTINGNVVNNGTLDIAANSLTLAGTYSGTGSIRSNGGDIVLNGTSNAGSLSFDQTTDGTTNSLANFTLNRTSSGEVSIANN